ncbi:hypothetical protein BCV70DRAFT_198237 [Testicularia cyperi]|uniref:Uncharacterized protein n=1 Tax=Testicularia cyperi TaxID=1882483 RepID=A0A317XX94_9BASI|nr:hypothetical protein BCV70DRAFT_198237 [Testicularia cyperi]
MPVLRAMHTSSTHTGTASAKADASSSGSRKGVYRTLGGGLIAAAGGGWYMYTPTDASTGAGARSFSVFSPAENEASPVNGSSTLIRPASPSAPRRQTVTLVFLTSSSAKKGLVKSIMSNFSSGGDGAGEAGKWFPWIAYFREAGYDCLQMNLALSSKASESISQTPAENKDAKTTASLTDELHSQIRMSNLQRLPVLFVHYSSDSDPASTSAIVSAYIDPAQSGSNGAGGAGGFLSKLFGGGGMFGSRPAISGLVVISDADDASTHAVFAKHPKLNTLIVANGVQGESTQKKAKVTTLDTNSRNQEQVIKDIERWLIREGYEG